MSASESPEDGTAQEPVSEESRRHTGNLSDDKHPVPLFLRGKSDGRHGDPQDEKDEAAE